VSISEFFQTLLGVAAGATAGDACTAVAAGATPGAEFVAGDLRLSPRSGAIDPDQKEWN